MRFADDSARLLRRMTGAIAVVLVTGALCGAADEPAHDVASHAVRPGSADEQAHQASDESGHDHSGHGDDEHGEAGHGDAAHAEDHAAADHGESQYDDVPLIFEPALAVWSLALFLVFLFVARKVAWVPLIAGLDAREARVNRALHDAEAARVEAEKLLAEHAARMEQVQEEVKGILAAARKDAEAEKARIIAEADAQAAAMRDQAIADIREAHRRALEDLEAQIERQAELATQHVLGAAR